MTCGIRGFVLSLAVFAAAPGGAEVLGLFIDSSVSNQERVGVVAPTTGAVTANDALGTTSTLFRVEADGTVLPSHAFTSSDPDITPGPTFLVVPEPAGPRRRSPRSPRCWQSRAPAPHRARE